MKQNSDQELLEAAARPPLRPATRDLNWRLAPPLSLLLARELVRLTTTAAMEAPGLDRANSFFSPRSILTGSTGLSRGGNVRELQGSMHAAFQTGKQGYCQQAPVPTGTLGIHPWGSSRVQRDTGYPEFPSLNQLLEVGCSASSELPQPRDAVAAPPGLWLFRSLQRHRKDGT